MFIEIFVAVAGGICSGIQFIGSRVLGMSVSEDSIGDIVRREAKAKYSR